MAFNRRSGLDLTQSLQPPRVERLLIFIEGLQTGIVAVHLHPGQVIVATSLESMARSRAGTGTGTA